MRGSDNCTLQFSSYYCIIIIVVVVVVIVVVVVVVVPVVVVPVANTHNFMLMVSSGSLKIALT